MGSTEFASAGRVRSIVMALFLVAAIALVVGGRANAAVLYDQVDPTSPESTTSQDFEAMFNNFDAMVADDFTVPVGRTWRLESVLFRGTAELPASLPTGMRVALFANSSNAPGTEISSQVAPITTGSYPRPNVTLPTPQILTPGTYWLGVQAVLNAGNFSGPQWFWADSDAGSFGNAAHFKNPGGGFDSDCVAFTIRSLCEYPDSFHPSHDQSFSLSGTDFSVAPDTEITSGPAQGSTIRTNSATFAFSTSEPEATFTCSVDGGPFEPCTSPVALTGLANGPHSFAARSANSLGGIDLSPAGRDFTVLVPVGPSVACLNARNALKKAKKQVRQASQDVRKAKGQKKKDKAIKKLLKKKEALKKATRAVNKNC